MAENTVTPPVDWSEPLAELNAIREEFLRGISILRWLARALTTMGDAELEESLQLATEHLDSTRNRMEGALLRLSREQRG